MPFRLLDFLIFSYNCCPGPCLLSTCILKRLLAFSMLCTEASEGLRLGLNVAGDRFECLFDVKKLVKNTFQDEVMLGTSYKFFIETNAFGIAQYARNTNALRLHVASLIDDVQRIQPAGRMVVARTMIASWCAGVSQGYRRWEWLCCGYTVELFTKVVIVHSIRFVGYVADTCEEDWTGHGGKERDEGYLVAVQVTVFIPPRAQFTREEEIGLSSMRSKSESRTSRNVVIIGHSGVGKSSLINMLCPSADVPIANDFTGCTKQEQAYSCDLGRQQSCTVHDTIGLEEGSWGFLWAPKAEKRLKAYLKKSKPHLVVYCMPGVRRSLKKSRGRNFNKFKSVVGKVPVVVVVTNLEDSRHPEDWWSANLDILRKLDIPESTQHACVTALPDAYLRRGLYNSSCEAVKALIRNNLPQC